MWVYRQSQRVTALEYETEIGIFVDLTKNEKTKFSILWPMFGF
jgi:hypothetical protein